MNWFPFQKKRQSILISKDVITRIEEESIKQGKPQVLFVELKRNQDGLGNVLVGFADKNITDIGFIRFPNKKMESILSLGELRFEFGKFYFYPNVDLEWKNTPKPNIYQITSNYEFSSEPIYLEAENFFRLRRELKECFQREGVHSVFFKKNICQLEISNLNQTIEERISEEILTYLSSLYQSPWVE
ncbi:hypothetical protein EHQ68_03035 [Leptospira congkakensis]|uniref:Uncharacterized protein n=1 Tax=Leptospira congkakensis TaxID=2484932 RepID=A0A4Z1ALN4_9LEPT|nr:hypothetical protein [Leptospira congkakensis]TGL90422.1 hypothetical protein EHQ69_10795 [Leptospira congkakensis]TGL91429.1 hypothetical protein EHQ68_03035 [Leptospira congkakensis]TGL98481.1 hypothetical protein EHQ70_02620 [Leptospira congkakensis]